VRNVRHLNADLGGAKEGAIRSPDRASNGKKQIVYGASPQGATDVKLRRSFP
jgi:hypothetical protein